MAAGGLLVVAFQPPAFRGLVGGSLDDQEVAVLWVVGYDKGALVGVGALVDEQPVAWEEGGVDRASLYVQ
ncbi:hypothetical protein, partial [Actinomadura darangshiensis]|uniref:hypothetical protein n=1 Tax=Actinomadura darangshiensis TaxID=705336 RepID=UPI001A9E8FFD